jgi:hypothetical protein
MLLPYRRRKKITINHTLIDNNLNNFTILISINNDLDIGTNSKSNGDDIRFTLDDGTTEINYEIEDFTIFNSKAIGNFWVKIPFLSSIENTIIFIYYGYQNAIKGSNPNSVWDNNYLMVLHMNDYNNNSVADSTIYGRNGNKLATNEPNEVDAKIGKGQEFDGIDDYIEIPTNFNIFDGTVPFSISFWFYMNNNDQDSNFIIGFLGERNIFIELLSNNRLRLRINPDNGWFDIFTTNSLDIQTWYFIYITYNNTIGYSLYINDELYDTNSNTNGIGERNAASWIGGWIQSNDRYFDGIIDEIRVSNITRTSSWIKTSYHSENNDLINISSEIKKRFIKTLNGISSKNIKKINGINVI